ncbi:MAG: coenzyme F420-0:L-glutamate ligase [Candidatus Beckwithbacteria bacterium]|nr:coenzyme F420-0:L-glutamate ligase [Patescibacteria group bacterium]
MQFISIKTRKFLPPKDNLYNLLDNHLPKLKEKDVLAITSKIISIHQGLCIKVDKSQPPLQQKINLIKKEADAYFKDNPHSLTIKDQTLTPYAGIDRSNANNHYVLWPKNPNQTAEKIYKYLRHQHKIKNLGILIIDSFCLPMRWGHMGISIGFHGFYPNQEYSGKKDIFNHKIIQGNSNIVDGLASLSAVLMGEGNEQTPLLLIRNFNKLKFTDKPTHHHLKIPKQNQDLYAPLIKHLQGDSLKSLNQPAVCKITVINRAGTTTRETISLSPGKNILLPGRKFLSHCS